MVLDFGFQNQAIYETVDLWYRGDFTKEERNNILDISHFTLVSVMPIKYAASSEITESLI